MLTRAGCRLHYWHGGPTERPLVAFLHGATMDHRMFTPQVEALLPRYRMLVWDARGHGLSKPLGDEFSLAGCAQDMLAILDEMGVAHAVFCGQSLGGYIAQHIYMAAPERVQALAIIGSTPLAKAYGRLDLWALKASLPLFRIWPYGHFARTVAKNTAETAPVRAYALDAARQIERADFLRIWRAVTLAIDDTGRPDLRMRVPLLLMHGAQDKTGSIRRDMPLWAGWEEQVQFHIIPDAGHNANQDNPDDTNRLLLGFLQQHVG